MAIKNTMTDLHNILFEELERLNDVDLKGDDLRDEINRAKQIGNTSQIIINNANLQLETAKFIDNQLSDEVLVPNYLDTHEKKLGA